jgi:hypothetical protein
MSDSGVSLLSGVVVYGIGLGTGTMRLLERALLAEIGALALGALALGALALGALALGALALGALALGAFLGAALGVFLGAALGVFAGLGAVFTSIAIL